MQQQLVFTHAIFDWKERPSWEDMQALLSRFGLVVTEHPACEGSDSYGFIVSNRGLSQAELDEVVNEVMM